MRTIKLTFVILLSSIIGYSQEGLNLDDLKAPTMPSATIIGTQINEVNKPKSLKEFEVAVLTNYLDSSNNLTLPNSYALEFQPGMIFRKNFDYNDLSSNNFWKNIRYTTSFSISSTTNFLINDSTSTNAMGIGVRSMLLNGRSGKKETEAYRESLTELNNMFVDQSRVITLFTGYYLQPTKHLGISTEGLSKEGFRQAVIAKIDSTTKLTEMERGEFRLIVNTFFSKLDENIAFENDLNDHFDEYIDTTKYAFDFDRFKNRLETIKNERYGLRLEWNLATGLSFPSNKFNYSIVPRWGTWLNLSYRGEKYKDLIGVLLLRYINNNEDFVKKFQPADTAFYANDLLDFGARIAYEKNKFSFEYEIISRVNFTKSIIEVAGVEYSRTDSESTFKHMLNINYRISDQILISYNLGKNFDTVQGNPGNLISGLSINFGFGKLNPVDFM